MYYIVCFKKKDNILNICFRQRIQQGIRTSAYYIPNGQEFNTNEFICSTEDANGMHKCKNLPHFVEGNMECHSSIETGLYNESECVDWNQYYTECKPGEMNPFDGAISFDNIGLAWVAIFLVSG